MHWDSARAGPFSAVIFDLDGVLVDTAEFHYRAWKMLADELGIPFDRRKNERLRGVSRMESLRIILEDMEAQPENVEKLADRKNRYYLEMIDSLTPAALLPGVAGVLATLRERDVKVGVASSSKNARTVIAKLKIDALLDAIVDGCEFENAKPAPDLFLMCARRMGKASSECVVVEDAQAGIEAARSAGMYAVGVCSGRQLQGADLLLRSVSDLPLDLFVEVDDERGIRSCGGAEGHGSSRS